MNTELDRSTKTDPKESDLRKIYSVTENWRSDSKFFADELQFFRSLLDKYFMKLIEAKNVEATKATVTKLTKLENKRVIFEQKVDRHFNHIASLVENPFSHDAQVYREEHAKLELALSDFQKDFKEMKKEIFQLAKQIMDAEKTSHLLSS